MNIYDGNVADRIRECAKKVGSGNELARLTGIKRRTLEDYMTKTSEPKASTLFVIAKAADVSLDWLIAGEATKATAKNFSSLDMEALEYAIAFTEKAMVSQGVTLSPEKKAAITALVYEDIYGEEDKEISIDNVIKFVRLAI